MLTLPICPGKNLDTFFVYLEVSVASKTFLGLPIWCKHFGEPWIGISQKNVKTFLSSAEMSRGGFFGVSGSFCYQKTLLNGSITFFVIFLSDSTGSFRRADCSVFLTNFWYQKILFIRGLAGFSDEKVSSHRTTNFPGRDLLVFGGTYL